MIKQLHLIMKRDYNYYNYYNFSLYIIRQCDFRSFNLNFSH